MSIRELGYVIFGSPDLAQWRSFGEQILGMAAADGPGDSLYLKMDDRDYRIAIIPGAEERFIAAGWGVADKIAFDALRTRLTGDGVEVTPGDEAGRGLRRVQDYYWLQDPAGNRYEIFWGPISDFKPS